MTSPAPRNDDTTGSLADRPHVLVVDDDDRIRQLVSRFLTAEGFVVVTAPDARTARQLLATLSFDVLVVDVMMPGEDGLSLTRDLPEADGAPVLMLTALGESGDRIAGLEAGADDYLAKPFEPRELVLRLQAILRRRPPPRSRTGYIVGRWRYDSAEGVLQNGDEYQSLTGVEANLLRALISRAGEAVSREELAALCEMEAEGERTIDVQVTRLRKKIENDPKTPRILQTVRGKGYLLRAERE